MERWEYLVIHLNVEAPTPAPPQPPAKPPAVEPEPGTPPIRVEAVFSKEYLEKEFPGFYGSVPPPGAPHREHPANQLCEFLNQQGRDGWHLLGIYPVGRLQMMIFRRPLLPLETDDEGATTSSSPLAGPASDVPAAPTAGVTNDATPDQPPALERLLERLEALERRLPPLEQQTEAAVTAPPEPSALADLQDGEILPPQRWAELDGQPRLSTPEAARALGFRSAASLLNVAARKGYQQGLVKRGVASALAVYMGSEKSGRGGRDRRLWVVLQADPG